MQVLEQWVMLLDERGLRATGMELLIRVENGKAPPLAELCCSASISLGEVERTISQDPSQCGEREVNTRTGMLPLHALLANQAEWPDDILALLLKCNHKQAATLRPATIGPATIGPATTDTCNHRDLQL